MPHKSIALLSCKDTSHFLVAFFIKSVIMQRSIFYIDGFNVYFEFVKSIMPDNVVGEGKIYSIPRKWKDLQ